MSTYREAITHARKGGTIKLGEKTVRFLTFEEAEPIVLERSPSRTVRRDSDGKAVVQDGKLIVDEFADPNYRLRNLGLFEFGGEQPIEFKPSDEHMYLPVELDEDGKEKLRVLREDWEIVLPPVPEPEPEAVPPETVDEVLTEEDSSE